MKIAISTDRSPSVPGVCSQAIQVGDLLFIGGVIPVVAATGQRVEGGAPSEAHQMLDNLEHILLAAGASLGDVVKVTMYVTDWSNYEQINAVYCERLNGVDPLPVRATVEVTYIGSDCACELEAIAVLMDPTQAVG